MEFQISMQKSVKIIPLTKSSPKFPHFIQPTPLSPSVCVARFPMKPLSRPHHHSLILYHSSSHTSQCPSHHHKSLPGASLGQFMISDTQRLFEVTKLQSVAQGLCQFYWCGAQQQMTTEQAGEVWASQDRIVFMLPLLPWHIPIQTGLSCHQ